MPMRRSSGDRRAEGARAPSWSTRRGSHARASGTTAEYEVLLYEFKDGIERLPRRQRRAALKTLADLIAFNKRARRAGDAVVRPGTVRAGAGQGTADRRGLSRRAATRRAGCAGPEGIDAALKAAASTRARAVDVAGLADRSGDRRPFRSAPAMAPPRWPAIPASRCRWAKRTACRSASCSWARAWSEPRLIATRLRLRAGHEGAQAAALPADHHHCLAVTRTLQGPLRRVRSGPVARLTPRSRRACARSASRSPAPARS